MIQSVKWSLTPAAIHTSVDPPRYLLWINSHLLWSITRGRLPPRNLHRFYWGVILHPVWASYHLLHGWWENAGQLLFRVWQRMVFWAWLGSGVASLRLGDCPSRNQRVYSLVLEQEAEIAPDKLLHVLHCSFHHQHFEYHRGALEMQHIYPKK